MPPRSLSALLLLSSGCIVDEPTDGPGPGTDPTREPTASKTETTTSGPEVVPPCTAPRVWFNELQASNVNGLEDHHGDTPDWIEIINADDVRVNLNGWWLSDDASELQKWPLPGVALNPDEHLLVFASGKNIGGGVADWITPVDHGHLWRYREITAPFEPGWQAPDYDDSAWDAGPSGFGRGDDDDATHIDAPMVHVRTEVSLSSAELADLVAVALHVDYDDGFVAWINGVEVARANVSLDQLDPEWDDYASRANEAALPSGEPVPRFDIDPSLLGEVNTLAVTVVDISGSSSDLSLVPILSLGFGSHRPGPTSTVVDLQNGELHTNFKLRADGERVLLTAPDGCIADDLNPGQTWADQSFGRVTDGSEELGYFLEPTPGTPNTTESRPGFAAAPAFDPAPGFYPGGVEVSVVAGPGARIVVASGGYEPFEGDPPLVGTIDVDGSDEAHVLRAQAYEDGLWPSSIATATYFAREPGPLPVVSVVTDPTHLWDWDTGIYVMGPNAEEERPHRGANFWEEWEKPGHLAMWEPSGDAAFDLNLGLEIFGGYSRARPQKSLQLKPRAGYGTPAIAYDVFPGLGVTEFEDLVLRNGGTDWLGCVVESCRMGSMFRDAVMHRFTEGVDIDRLAFRATETYINGAYWGIQNLRERAAAPYIAAHHGIEDIDLLKRKNIVMEGDTKHLQAMLAFMRSNDLTDPAVYATLETMIDIEEFSHYLIFEIWFDNRDWLGNNIKSWRPRTPHGRWRWLLYDVDRGIGLYDKVDGDTLAYAMAGGDPAPSPAPTASEIFQMLLEVPAFRIEFANRYADLMNTLLAPGRTRPLVDAMEDLYTPVMGRHIERWGIWDDGTTYHRIHVADWEQEVADMHTWLEQRSSHATAHVVSNLGLPGTWNLRLQAHPPGAGTFELTAVTVDAPFDGTYFLDVPVTITAVPAKGYQFSGWSDGGLPNTATLTLDPSGSMSLTAQFE